jgi:glutamine synthetase adenylyltransferase
MDDKEWVAQELAQYRKDEIEAAKRVMKAREEVAKAKAELAAAKERLAGARGGIIEFEFQTDYLNKHGRLA